MTSRGHRYGVATSPSCGPPDWCRSPALTVMSLVGLGGTGIAAALGDRLGPVPLLNVQGIGLVAGGLFVIAALRPAISGVTPATERTLTSAGRSA